MFLAYKVPFNEHRGFLKWRNSITLQKLTPTSSGLRHETGDKAANNPLKATRL